MPPEYRAPENGIDRRAECADQHQSVAKPVRRYFAAKRLRAEHGRDAGKPEGDAENVAARQRLTAGNRGDDQGLDREGGNADRTTRGSRVLQRHAESPGKEAEE